MSEKIISEKIHRIETDNDSLDRKIKEQESLILELKRTKLGNSIRLETLKELQSEFFSENEQNNQTIEVVEKIKDTDEKEVEVKKNRIRTPQITEVDIRDLIILSLEESPKTQEEISKELGIQDTKVTISLTQLRKQKQVRRSHNGQFSIVS